jgi:hypothetical protein
VCFACGIPAHGLELDPAAPADEAAVVSTAIYGATTLFFALTSS